MIYLINPTDTGAIRDNSYNQGYQDGYYDGEESGKNIGIEVNQSQINKNSASYIAGYRDGQESTNELSGMVISIAETPIKIFRQIFDFNILGFNISQFLFSIISLLLVVFLIKKIIK